MIKLEGKCCTYLILREFGAPMKLVMLITICLNERYSKVLRGKCLSYNFQLCFRKCHYECLQIQTELKLNRTHSLLGYAHDVNLLGDNIYNIKKNTETVVLVRMLIQKQM
jgi:hypothetical protein